ncbi:MAG: PAS domain-containing protein [Balneolaceae bacterium]
MDYSRNEIQKQFKSHLETFISDQNEEILAAVYELGRCAIKEGIGELEVLGLYHESLDRINERQNDTNGHNKPILALDFLTEFLAPYEMRQRGFKDLITQLNEQNQLLRKEVEERVKTQEELRSSKEYFQHLIENALDIITVANYNGTIRYASPAIEKILGYLPDNLVGKNIFDYIHPDDIQEVKESLANVSKAVGNTLTIEFRIKHNDESWTYLESIAKNVRDLRDGPGVIVNSRDVTERVQNHQKLQQSQQKIAVAQQIAHLGSWEWDVNEDELNWSAEMSSIYGLPQGACPESFEAYLAYIHPEDVDRTSEILGKAFETGSDFEFEHRIIRADGEQRTLYCKGGVKTDKHGTPVEMVGIGQDISRMKEAEEQLREYSETLKSFMAKEEKTREEERIRIAREIHDELGQMLTVLKLDISMVANDAKQEFGTGKKPAFINEISSITSNIDTIIKSVQRISKDLRPDIFDHLGLDEALQWQAKEFEKRTGIKCIMNNTANCIEQLVDERSIAIYRIFQETLTNVLRHADATQVDISLSQNKQFFILNIKDNGKGITQKKLKQSNSLGIIGMRERSQFLRGDIKFESEKGKGTTVTLKIPLNETAKIVNGS